MAEEKKNFQLGEEQDHDREPVQECARSGMPREKITMEKNLMSDMQSELLDMAQSLNLQVSGKEKEQLAAEIAEYLLIPEHMRLEFLSFSEEELDAFETVIENPRSMLDYWESRKLDQLWSQGYVTMHSDGSYEVPEDVEAVYSTLRKNGYREYHIKVGWMINCLLAFVDLYMAAPTEVLYKIYQGEETLNVSYEEFLQIFEKVPDEMNPCRMTDGMAMSRQLEVDELYEELEEVQLDVEYYILTKEEVLCRARDGYMSSSKEYQALEKFIIDKMDDDVDCYSLCLAANNIFMNGGSVSDVLKELKRRKIRLPVGKDAEIFENILTETGNHTRMMIFRGHTPLEIYENIDPDQLEKLMMPIPPEGRKPVRRAEGEKKIYPNDPCPCGSGKKYKKCCGRK
ncbi:MAG: SEC-C domain-containing protein [Lachnospiraceae bacterium]|nr:SEC-C domain-containing protein [Lachnospiraceae bacterium]